MMILHRFPVDYQMDSQDCGPACLKIIAKYFGRFYSLQYLRDQCGITKQGVSLADLSIGAESIGLRTLAIKCTLEDVVNQIPFPAILFWKENLFLPTSPLILPPFYPNQNKNQYSHNNTNTSKNKVSETFVHPDLF